MSYEMIEPQRRFKPSSRARRAPGVVLCALVVAHASPSWGITLADPVTFTEKQTWSATTLGIPLDIAGIRFSSDGSTLYVVGNSDTPSSAMYAVPVMRDGTTNEITQLGMASSFFSGNVSTPYGGLDSGPEEGPGGTLFYTYLFANDGNFIGQRRAGDLNEMQFDLEPLGVPLYLSGLAFSPFRIDPSTDFGYLQVAILNGDPDTSPRNIYEIPLTPLGPPNDGFFMPGTATRLLTLVPNSVASGFTYVPVGALAGSLMYADFDAGEIRYLDIDAASGLAIDSVSGLPELGTVNPVEHLFASDLSVGPVGVDFDPLTNDLFISTYQGTPSNSIIQVGGFSATSTTTTSIAPPTTAPPSSTTTTTLAPTCSTEATFDALACRLETLHGEVRRLDAGTIGVRLEKKLTAASSRLQTGQAQAAGGRRRPARAALGKAKQQVRGFGKLLASRKGRSIAAEVRTMLTAEARGIETDLVILKKSL